MVPDIVYIGTRSTVSALPLQALLAAGMSIVAVIVPARAWPGEPPAPLVRLPANGPWQLPMVGRQADLVSCAEQARIPLFAAGNINHPASLELLRSLQPDAICVACFPHRLRSPLLALPRLGCLNVHPSLLPHYRGPAPLFWTLRDGLGTTGVTVHLMDADFDSGPMLRQEHLALPPGLDGAGIDLAWAELGGRLLVEALAGLAAGTLVPQAQAPGGSYQSWPTAADFRIEAEWSALRAFNFMRGTSAWNYPYVLDIAGKRLELRAAIALEPADPAAPPVRVDGSDVLVRFAGGRVRAR
jgi:methionyl-tRNA formyltransferase